MKLIKMMMIAAFAALAVMAVTTASASANAKECSTTHENGAFECDGTAAHGWLYGGNWGASVTTGTTEKLTANNGATVSCTESTLEGQIENGENGTGKVTKLSLGGCTSTTICTSGTTAETNASTTSPWKMTATTTIPGTVNTNGKMSILNTDMTATIKCIGITTCIYKAENAVFDITGSDVVKSAILHWEAVPFTRTFGSEGTCGTSATWSATFTVTTPLTYMII